MRELTEQEIKYRNQKFSESGLVAIREVVGFDNGFIAGVESQQAEIEQLRAALKMVKSVVIGDDMVAYFLESEVAQIDAALGNCHDQF